MTIGTPDDRIHKKDLPCRALLKLYYDAADRARPSGNAEAPDQKRGGGNKTERK